MLKKVMLLVAAGYALVLALVLLLGLMTIASMGRLHQIANDIYDHPFTVNDAALDAQANILWMEHYLSDIAATSDPGELDALLLATEALDKKVRNKLGVVEERFLGDREKVKEVGRLLNEWQTLRNQVVELPGLEKMKRANKTIPSSGAKIFAQLNLDMDYIVSFTRQRAVAYVAEADEEATANINLAKWLLVGLITVIGLSGGYVARRIYLLIRHEQQVEVELRNNSALLEAANKELESFSYSVSHDLRVPLRAIDGFSRILLEEYQGKLDVEGQRLLNVVRNNTQKMAQLIDDILAFSRTGRVEMSHAEIDMEDLVRDVMEELRPAATGRDVNLNIKPLPSAHADRIMMHQVLVNLLDNAIKFTRPKTMAQIEVGAIEEKNEVVYYVKDNGVGFDMQYSAKLFGVFQHLHRIEEFEGTGVGLAIVKRIITRHGGRVWAEGKVNEGATIYFSLPTKEKDHG